MSRAQAAGTVPDIENIKREFDHLTRLYSVNHERYEGVIQSRFIEFGQLVKSNSSGSDSTNLHELILLNIHKLKYATSLLENITRISTNIADNLKECERLKTKLLHLEKPVDMPKSPVVTITPNGSVVVVGNATVDDGYPALNVPKPGELQRKMGPPVSSVRAPSGVPSVWRPTQPPSGQSLSGVLTKPLPVGWVGGSKTTQVGGREAYPLPISSKLYVDAVTQVNPLTPENNPRFFKNLEKAILDKTIQPVRATEPENEPSHDTSLSPAAQSAKNPNVIKNLIMNLNAKTEDAQTSIIKNYEDLVMMCDKTTALELIKPLLKPKKGETIPSDKKLLTMLGWNGNDNELLYDINKRRKGGGGVFVQGLFSFFCFDNGKFSVGFSRHCGRNYVCMLNWVIIVAFRLKMRDPDIYTDALIIKLIENMHHALWLKDTNVDNFTKNTGDNAGLYIVGAKTSMNNGIFNYGDLKVLVEGIKSEVQKIPEPSSSGGSYHNTTHKLSHKNVKGGNKVTTRKHHHHRHPTIHNVGHTVKVAQKPTDVNTIKTRRIHHAVKT